MPGAQGTGQRLALSTRKYFNTFALGYDLPGRRAARFQNR